jgi:hypothetical protein
MIELFKTNIDHKNAQKQVLMAIKENFPGLVATLELEDKDKILRIVGAWAPVNIERIIDLVKKQGFLCERLTD